MDIPIINFHGEVHGQFNAVTSREWFQIDMCVDSGACETVMPIEMCEGIPITPSAASIAKQEYEVANGQSIMNIGERKRDAITINDRDNPK